jgi:hypothetical protein
VKLNGEFFAECQMLASFCLAKKFGEIDPWWKECLQKSYSKNVGEMEQMLKRE